jgi:hypothetical protein
MKKDRFSNGASVSGGKASIRPGASAIDAIHEGIFVSTLLSGNTIRCEGCLTSPLHTLSRSEEFSGTVRELSQTIESPLEVRARRFSGASRILYENLWELDAHSPQCLA